MRQNAQASCDKTLKLHAQQVDSSGGKTSRTKTEFLLFYIVLFGAGSMFFAVGLFTAKAMKQEGA